MNNVFSKDTSRQWLRGVVQAVAVEGRAETAASKAWL